MTTFLRDEAHLMEIMTTPGAALVEFMRHLQGDILVLGAGGKMGPSLCILAQRAMREAGSRAQVIAVSRYSDPAVPAELEAAGVRVIPADLMDTDALAALPFAENVIYMAGRKFGTSGGEALTWAMNAYLPGLVAQKYKDARIVAFSTGNIYPHTPLSGGGSVEGDAPSPLGEYAQSCLGRERVFEHFSQSCGTRVLLYRLFYAAETRYGVLRDIASAVWEGRPVKVSMGVFNCVWQGDANDWAIRSLALCDSPARALNATGPETLSTRATALAFGRMMGKEAVIEGEEGPRALFASSREICDLLGYPSVPPQRLMEWVAHWVMAGGEAWDKPTHFEETQGKY